MTNDPSIWTGYPEKNLLDKSLSYMISFLSRDVGYYLYVTAHDKTKYWLL